MEASTQIVEKVLNDNDFAQQLVADPEATLRSVGVEPSPEIVNALRNLDAEGLQRMAAAFGLQGAAAAAAG